MPTKKRIPNTPKEPRLPIAEFINRYRRSTGYVYRSGLLEFFDFIAGKRMRGYKSTDADLPGYEAFALNYLADEKRNYSGDVIKYTKKQEEDQIPPKTAHIRIVAVKEFLSSNNIELDVRSLKDIKRLKPKGGKRTNFEYVDRKVLGEILHHVDARGKAFILLLASSGLRLGEALNLSWIDIKVPDRTKYPNKPASVYVRNSKTGQSRTTYITRECEEALGEWKKVYSNYREFATKRSLNLKTPSREKKRRDDNVFPFTRTSVYAMWDGALKKAGYFNRDAGTQRLQMNLHRLRNFFSVQVESAAGGQVSELLLGHSDQYGGAYTGRSPEQLEIEYMKAEHLLTIGATSSQVETTQREVAELRRQLDEMKERSRAFEENVLIQLTTPMELYKHADGFLHIKNPDEEKLKRFGFESVKK
jgi:integrase